MIYNTQSLRDVNCKGFSVHLWLPGKHRTAHVYIVSSDTLLNSLITCLGAITQLLLQVSNDSWLENSLVFLTQVNLWVDLMEAARSTELTIKTRPFQSDYFHSPYAHFAKYQKYLVTVVYNMLVCLC